MEIEICYIPLAVFWQHNKAVLAHPLSIEHNQVPKKGLYEPQVSSLSRGRNIPIYYDEGENHLCSDGHGLGSTAASHSIKTHGNLDNCLTFLLKVQDTFLASSLLRAENPGLLTSLHQGAHRMTVPLLQVSKTQSYGVGLHPMRDFSIMQRHFRLRLQLLFASGLWPSASYLLHMFTSSSSVKRYEEILSWTVSLKMNISADTCFGQHSQATIGREQWDLA